MSSTLDADIAITPDTRLYAGCGCPYCLPSGGRRFESFLDIAHRTPAYVVLNRLGDWPKEGGRLLPLMHENEL